MKFRLDMSGSQGHRLLATHDLNYGNPQTCIDLHNISMAIGDAILIAAPTPRTVRFT